MEPIQIITIAVAAILFIIAFWVAIRTNLLRESGSSNPVSPYSFSRFQLWLWTWVICTLFVVRVGDYEPTSENDKKGTKLNETCLILLGISAVGSLTSKYIAFANEASMKKKETSNPERRKLKKELQSISFWVDILLDDEGQFSVLRLQQLIFTIAYVSIFIIMFFTDDMAFPDFDKSAYYVMGISSGSYLIGKGLRK